MESAAAGILKKRLPVRTTATRPAYNFHELGPAGDRLRKTWARRHRHVTDLCRAGPCLTEPSAERGPIRRIFGCDPTAAVEIPCFAFQPSAWSAGNGGV